MSKFVARAKVLATTFVTYAVIVNVAVSAAVVSMEPFSGTPWVGDVAKWGGVAASTLATAVAIVRKVTQVPDELTGLLLPEQPEFYSGVDDFERFWETEP